MSAKRMLLTLSMTAAIVVASIPAWAQIEVRTETGVHADAHARAGADRSRYRHHNGYWWYRTDNDGWVYYRDGRWYDTRGSLYSRTRAGLDADVGVGGLLRGNVDADLRADGSARAGQSPYRYHNGHWWYRTDGRGWVFYRDGSWYDTRGNLFSQSRGGVQVDAGNVLRGLDSNIRGNTRGTFEGHGGGLRGLIDR